MKHTLKLLLTTSTLILPSAFAADHLEHPGDNAAGTTELVTVAVDSTRVRTINGSFNKLKPDAIGHIIGSLYVNGTVADEIIQSMRNREGFDLRTRLHIWHNRFRKVME